MKYSQKSVKIVLEFNASSEENKHIHNVVIPQNGGSKEGCYTDGFKRYTQLVYEFSKKYLTLPQVKKRQFVIDKILMPLLNEERKFYRYDKETKGYVMLDLTDEKELQNFTTKVMQKFCDVTKRFDDSDSINTNKKRQVSPTQKAEHKKAKKVDPSPVPGKSDQINVEEDSDFEEDAERPVDISSQFSPLLNNLLSHPDAQQFRKTASESMLNLDAIKQGLDDGSYTSISAVEEDLKTMLSRSTTKRGSNNFLALVTTYCSGLKTFYV